MKYDDLLTELTRSTEMIRALLDGITQEESQRRPAPDSWSALEVICHLYDEEREDFREHLDFILHRQDEEWHRIDPEGWVTERAYNEQDFDQMRAKFFAEREASLNWLQEFANMDLDKTYTSEFGTMTAGEMLACWIAHDNLHVRQLVELRRVRIESITKPASIEYAGEW